MEIFDCSLTDTQESRDRPPDALTTHPWVPLWVSGTFAKLLTPILYSHEQGRRHWNSTVPEEKCGFREELGSDSAHRVDGVRRGLLGGVLLLGGRVPLPRSEEEVRLEPVLAGVEVVIPPA